MTGRAAVDGKHSRSTLKSNKLVSKTEAAETSIGARGQRVIPEEDDETAGLLPEAEASAVAVRDDEDDDQEEDEEEDEEPLNSQDDVSEEEPELLFESENLVVCQYEKVGRVYWSDMAC